MATGDSFDIQQYLLDFRREMLENFDRIDNRLDILAAIVTSFDTRLAGLSLVLARQ